MSKTRHEYAVLALKRLAKARAALRNADLYLQAAYRAAEANPEPHAQDAALRVGRVQQACAAACDELLDLNHLVQQIL
jgi:hypothetical protein